MEYLDPTFVAAYATQKAPWGFNGLGEVVYLRTYSRPVSEPLRAYMSDPEWLDIPDQDKRRKEQWHETITRCINGAQDIGADYTKEEMERLFDHIFNLRASFSGRALWQLGTPLVKKLGGASLQNCFFTAIEKIEDFEFLMDMLMLGGGVGFSIERSSIHELPKVKQDIKIWHENTNDADIIVPDKREGWSRLLHSVLKSYFYTGNSFSYSTILIRRFGAPLKGFGGTASGPEALIEGITDICKIMDARAGKKLRSIDVLDICNIIGRLVVAGSARRSAQIALGDPDDYLFLGAKDWSTGNVPGWRENSNNSIIIDDWEHIVPKVWKGYDGTGEPYGFINRELQRHVGRLGEKKNDHRIMGMNPCVIGETLIAVADGRGAVPIADLAAADKDVPVYTFDPETQKPTIRMMRRPHKTGENLPVVRVNLDNGESITCTPNHKFILRDGSTVEAQDLAAGTSLRLLTRYQSSFNPSDLCEAGSDSNYKAISVEDAGTADVYNGTVDEHHSYFMGGWESETESGKPKFHFILSRNCGELNLEDGEACNLATIFLPNVSSYKQFLDISKLLYRTQKATTKLSFPYEKTVEVVSRNARLGQNVTGVLQATEEQLGWLDTGYQELKAHDIVHSKEKGWNPSISLTTIQPGGTLPLLAGVTAGMSPAEDEYFIRRVRFGSGDPMVDDLRARGHKIQYDIGIDGHENHSRVVVDFYCESPKGAVIAKNLTAVEHLEWQKRIQTIWADNAVSITVRYRPSELPAIKTWLAENYNSSVKSVSFLLLDDHNFKLAPLESITELEYQEGIRSLDLSIPISHGGDLLDLGCDTGACPIR